LKEHALKLAGERTVNDVRIGLSYTAVQLSDQSVGVAMTFNRDIGQRCSSMKQTIAGRQASEVISRAESPDLIERTVAIATINAVLNTDRNNLIQG
jgi:uncharacterized protein